jgi:hypothetical protein
MKKIVILSSYADNEYKENVLIDSIHSFKKLGYDILLVSHTPIKSNIQGLVNYFIYDFDNTLLPINQTPYTWFDIYDLHFRINKKGHVLPICRNVLNSINFIISQNYDFFIFSESDNILSDSDISKLKNLVDDYEFKDKKMIFFKPNDFIEHGSLVYETLFFAGNPNYFLSKFTPPKNMDEWYNSNMSLTFELTFFDKFNEFENDFIIVDTHSSEFFKDSKMNIFRYDTFIFDFIYNEINPDEVVLFIKNLIPSSHVEKIVIKINDTIIEDKVIVGGYWEYRTFPFDGQKYKLEYYINDILQKSKEYVLEQSITENLKVNGSLSKKKNNLDVQSIDVICLTNTKDKDYFNMTKYALETLHSSEKKYKFNVNLVESNYNSSYNYDNLVTNYIKPNEPFNYNKFLNICNKYITSDWVIIINNDVFFEKDWFNNIVKEHQKNNDIKSFSPKDPRHFNKWFPWAIFEYDNNIYEGYTIAQMVFGWCLVMKKEVWDLIYPWDENFVLYYQDNDYVEMLKSLGIRHAMVNNSIVNHLGSMTVDVAFGEKEDDNIKDSELTFINKWNRF